MKKPSIFEPDGIPSFGEALPLAMRSGFHIGAGFPVIMGISFVYVPSMQAILV